MKRSKHQGRVDFEVDNASGPNYKFAKPIESRVRLNNYEPQRSRSRVFHPLGYPKFMGRRISVYVHAMGWQVKGPWKAANDRILFGYFLGSTFAGSYFSSLKT